MQYDHLKFACAIIMYVVKWVLFPRELFKMKLLSNGKKGSNKFFEWYMLKLDGDV